jgi:chorismate dehydratase
VRIGCVKFLNARPLIHGWQGDVIFDDPSALCRMLAAGEIDAALASSIEFLRNPIYRIVNGVSISSDGEVYSVIVAHEGETPSSEIELDPASETSAVLLRCLFHGLRAAEIAGDRLSPLTRSRLLIGDTAIRFRQKFGDRYRYWDLGEEWKRRMQLPFVYALWFIRPELENAHALGDQLRALRDQNLRKIDMLISQVTEFDREFCRRYLRDNVRFDFGEREQQGLTRFAETCADCNLIPQRDLALDLV